jgi:hypothetical protein
MSDFTTALVREQTIGDITSDVVYPVLSGPASTTYQRFPATSASNSSLIYSVQIPSENVVIGRDVLLTSGLSFTMTAGNSAGVGSPGYVPSGQTAFDYGKTDALQAFPLASLFTTMQCSINNTSVSINLQDVLPSLLRLNNSRELYKYNSMTPSLPDFSYARYIDGVGASNNGLAGYSNASYDDCLVPRGAFPASITITRTDGSSGATDSSPIAVNDNDTWVIEFSTVVTEPLFLSPFIFGDATFNSQGLLGINNMSFTFNVDATCKRLFSTANPYIRTISLGTSANPNGFTAGGSVGTLQIPSNPALLFKFLSTQPEDLIETKNTVGYMDFPRYLTSSSNTVTVAPQGSATLTSSNLQLNQLPDCFIITVRKPMTQQTIQDATANFTINNISINLNNQSGLLSSASQQDLWRMSQRNNSMQSWSEFSGLAQSTVASTGVGSFKNTSGSILIVNPAYDLSLPSYLTAGSLGNYNFQFQVGVTNTISASGGASITPEICVIAVNSGIMTTQQGVSAIYTGILTKQMVLDAKTRQQASAMKSSEIKRMIGGNMLNMPLHGILRTACKRFGGVSSGGVSSGGVTSGGMKDLC